MPFFSERLVVGNGSSEYLLKEPVILVSNQETVEKATVSGAAAYYDNRSVKNFIEHLVRDAGNDDLAVLRSYAPAEDPANDEVEEFCCPITLMPMRNPVVPADGVSYEREALEAWLNSSASQGRTPLKVRMVDSTSGNRLPMPENSLLSALIGEHALRLEQRGVEYTVGVDFSEFQPNRWDEFLERAKFRFMAAAATGLLTTISLLQFLESLETSVLLSIAAGTTSVIVGTTVSGVGFTLATTTNAADVIDTTSRALTDTSSTLFRPATATGASAAHDCSR